MKTLILIDSNAIIHRAYHAIPKSFKNRQGEMTNVTYGYTTTLIKALEDLKPDYVIASFDLAGKTFRHEEFAEYKAQRVKADQELYDQIPRVRELLEVLNIPVFEKEGFEADDIIGTITSRIQNTDNRKQLEHKPQLDSGSQDAVRNDKNQKSSSHSVAGIPESDIRHTKYNIRVYIVTGDKDAFQLVDGNIFVYNLKGGLSQTQIVDRKKIKEDWNLDPEDFIDLKALAGDPSDNIPGVPGIGTITATKLLQKFDTMEKMYEELESNFQFSIFNFQSISNDKNFKIKTEQLGIKPRILQLLIDNKEQAFLSQRLATIRKDVPMDFDLEKSAWGDYDRGKLAEFFQEMGFKSLLKRFGIEEMTNPKTKKAVEQKEKDQQLKLL